MASIEQEKKTRKRKFEEINIENEDEKLEYEDHNCTSNENNNAHTIRFEHDIKTKLEICNYS